jgi:hypothetical protein
MRVGQSLMVDGRSTAIDRRPAARLPLSRGRDNFWQPLDRSIGAKHAQPDLSAHMGRLADGATIETSNSR